MKVKLKSTTSVSFLLHGSNVVNVDEGEVIEAKITAGGVSLLLEGVWSLPYYYDTIDEVFKIVSGPKVNSNEESN